LRHDAGNFWCCLAGEYCGFAFYSKMTLNLQKRHSYHKYD
jgi:hypothetical protein